MKIVFPVEDKSIISELRAGDFVEIKGTLYTARDAAHKRLIERIRSGEDIFEFLKGACIFYTGPAIGKNQKITALGPTTAARVDEAAIELYKRGVTATLGKGPRSKQVVEACRDNASIYLITYGGAGSYLACRIKSFQVHEYADLGPEAIYELEVENFPAVVGIDSRGNVYPDWSAR